MNKSRLFVFILAAITLLSGCSNQTNNYKDDNELGGNVKNSDAKTFKSYECTKDCSGHIAGYNWAESKSISNVNSCTGKSNSFIEGCKAYVEGNID